MERQITYLSICPGGLRVPDKDVPANHQPYGYVH